MPKSKREVSSSDSSASSDEERKPAKKSKGSGDRAEKPSASSKPAASSQPAASSGAKPGYNMVNGEPTWDLGNKKFAKVRSFKGRQYVDIREYWEDKGELKPGKKGVSMNMQQWDLLTQSIAEINQKL